MSKRGAGSELNHDNWDKEEEQEEAGEFKKASSEQMKGRVVKKAKRKLTEDSRKNVFSGFGGFTSGNKSVSEVFSFLGQAAKKEEKEPKELKESKVEEDTNNDLMAKFKPVSGNWSCEVCMVSNLSDKTKCMACETPKPGNKATSEPVEPKQNSFIFGEGGGFKFANTVSSDTTQASVGIFGASKGDTSEPAGSGFQFGNFSSENKKEGDGFLKGGGELKTEEQDLMAKFKPVSGNWACEVCMISNAGDKTKCVACETPKPGTKIPSDPAAAEPVKTSFSFGDQGGFKFAGISSVENTTGSGFKFGGDFGSTDSSKNGSEEQKGSVDKSKPVSTSGEIGGFKFASTDPSKSAPGFGFNFGNSSEEKIASPLDGFGSSSGKKEDGDPKPDSLKPGEKSISETEETKQSSFCFGEGGGFKFSATESSSSTSVSGFTFGEVLKDKQQAESKKEDLSKKNVETPSPIGFKFGEIKAGRAFENTSGGFQFDQKKNIESSGSETPKSGKKREYLSCLKALNIQVTNWIKSHVDENPLVDLTPVFKDYKNHIDELKKKFKDGAGMSPNKGRASDKSIDIGTKEKEEEVEKPFSFGFNKTGFGSSSSPFSPGPASLEFGTFNKGDKVEETKTEIANENEQTVTGAVEPTDETDSLYSKKCKLFYKKGEAYVERGLGHIHLKQTEDGRLQVVVRADTSLGNILLNIVMSSNVPMQRQGKNNLLLVCVPNPPLDSKGEVEPIPFLIRVKTAEDADELKEKMTELIKSDTE